jgi:archaellum component FlaC
MKRVDVYVSDEQYEKWKQKAESEGMSVSSFVKKAVESAFSNGFVGKKDEMIAKLEERVSDLEYELDLVMFALDKVDTALKKLNRGEKLELNDFVYSTDERK